MNRLVLITGIVSVLLVLGIGTLVYLDHRPAVSNSPAVVAQDNQTDDSANNIPPTTDPLQQTSSSQSDQTSSSSVAVPPSPQPVPPPPPPASPSGGSGNILDDIGKAISDALNSIGDALGINPPPPADTTQANSSSSSSSTSSAEPPPAIIAQAPPPPPEETSSSSSSSSADNGQTSSAQSSSSSSSSTGKTVSIMIANAQFATGIVNISIGDTIKWVNNDKAPRAITALNNAFDSGAIAPGTTFTHRFDQAGLYDYHNSFMPSMVGKIQVN